MSAELSGLGVELIAREQGQAVDILFCHIAVHTLHIERMQPRAHKIFSEIYAGAFKIFSLHKF